MPVRVSSVTIGNTVATFQCYPSLHSYDSESEEEMEGPCHPAIDGMAETKDKLANMEQKNKEKSFPQTWQEAATPETQDPIGRVVAILERPKVEDAQVDYLNYLKVEKAAGRGDRQTLRDLSRAEAEYKKRMLEFSCKAPAYDGNPAKVFDWCGELEKHLSRNECETIPNEAIKRMLLNCITERHSLR